VQRDDHGGGERAPLAGEPPDGAQVRQLAAEQGVRLGLALGRETGADPRGELDRPPGQVPAVASSSPPAASRSAPNARSLHSVWYRVPGGELPSIHDVSASRAGALGRRTDEFVASRRLRRGRW